MKLNNRKRAYSKTRGMDKRIKQLISGLLFVAVMITSFIGINVQSMAANQYTVNGVTVSCESSSITDNCWTYAREIYPKIWPNASNFTAYRGTNDDALRLIEDISERTITAEHVQKYISAVPLGAVIRLASTSTLDKGDGDNDANGHSQILVQKDANGFTVLESNVGGGRRDKYMTWTQYASAWKTSSKGVTRYFKYIKAPGVAAISPSTPTTKPSAPTNFQYHWEPVMSSNSNYATAVLSWSAVSGATSYEVQYCGGAAGSTWKADTDYKNSAQTQYTSTEIQYARYGNRNYKYRVRAIANGVASDWTELSLAKEITVTFNSNGGSSVSAKTISYNGTNMTYGTLPTPTRSGYNFDGWYYTASSGGTKVSSSSEYNGNGSDVTLYAHWTTHSHTWNSGTVTKAATCGTSGVRTYTCTGCGETKTETISATGQHSWNSGSVTKAATCKETGIKTYTCTVCGTTRTETIAVTGNHQYGPWTYETASQHKRICTICGQSAFQTHTFNSQWESDSQYHYHVCTVCGGTKDKASHSPNGPATEKDAETCAVCGYVIKPALGHVHNWSSGWASNVTLHYHTCSGCSEKSEVAGHVYDNDCDPDCNVCKARRDVDHSFERKSDQDAHWNACTRCGTVSNRESHIPGAPATASTPQVCSACGYIIHPAQGNPAAESEEAQLIENVEREKEETQLAENTEQEREVTRAELETERQSEPSSMSVEIKPPIRKSDIAEERGEMTKIWIAIISASIIVVTSGIVLALVLNHRRRKH